MTVKDFGTKWSVEFERARDGIWRAYVTNAQSAQTVEVWENSNDRTSLYTDCLALWARVPKYIKRYVACSLCKLDKFPIREAKVSF